MNNDTNPNVNVGTIGHIDYDSRIYDINIPGTESEYPLHDAIAHIGNKHEMTRDMVDQAIIDNARESIKSIAHELVLRFMEIEKEYRKIERCQRKGIRFKDHTQKLTKALNQQVAYYHDVLELDTGGPVTFIQEVSPLLGQAEGRKAKTELLESYLTSSCRLLPEHKDSYFAD